MPALFIAALIAAGLWIHGGLGSHHQRLSKLVLQLGDLGPEWTVAATNTQQAPIATSSAGYQVAYRRVLGGNDLAAAPFIVDSFVYRSRTPAAAHTALAEAAPYAKRLRGLRGRVLVPPNLGDETLLYGRAPHPSSSTSRPSEGFYLVMWRSGNTIAGLAAIGFNVGLRADSVNLARVMQSRIGRGA